MPKAIRTLPSAEYLHQCFEYDAANGELRWRHRPREHFESPALYVMWNKQHAGRVAGWPSGKGHLRVRINLQRQLVHRVIYKMHYQAEPEIIDHIDRNPQNNRIDNLRSATIHESNRNRSYKAGACGFVGVTIGIRGRFRASIKNADGKSIHLGSFDTAEQAHAAYRAAANRIFGEFSPFRVG